jgi:methionyl aminopeptidase
VTSPPDPSASQAWLIGTSRHTAEPELPDLPSVANNLTDLGAVLAEPRQWGLPPKNRTTLLDPMRPPEVVRSLRQAAASATDTLLIYCSGHGLLDNEGSLFLALSETSLDRELLKYTALAVDDIRNAMRNSPAANKILILDCCYSGRAIAAMTDTQSTITAALEIRGAVTLAAAPATKVAISPPGARNTAFTAALLTVLRRGIAYGPELLTLDLIFEQLRSRLLAGGYPLPQIQSLNTAHRLALVRNEWWTSAPEGADTPGTSTVAPPPQVPGHIRRPAYVGMGKAPARDREARRRPDPETVDRMRRAGLLAARTLNEVGREVRPGVTTDRLDEMAREFIFELGGYPSLLGYNGFAKSVCASVNDTMCNGVPNARRLRSGDIVNIALGVYLDGVHAKLNRTFPVGIIDESSELLIAHAQVALTRAIRSIRPGRELNVVGRAIEACAKRGGYGVVRQFTGHGIGPELMNGLIIPNYEDHRQTDILEPGLTFTVHPMLTLGDIEHNIADDGWTVKTRDGSRAAEAGHTVVVTDTGAEILTQLPV